MLDEVHVSELSIYEAKAKFRLSRMNRVYADALENFGDNLAVLKDDERICKGLGLDVFDAIIVAQSVDVVLLITEDTEILNLRNQEAFVEDLS